MSAGRKGVTLIGSLSAVLTILGGLAIYFPHVREWMDLHDLAGWIVATIAVSIVPLAVAFGQRGHELSLSTATEKRARDYELVSERLGGWTATEEFMSFMTHDVNHEYFPRKFAHQMSERIQAWGRFASGGDPTLEGSSKLTGQVSGSRR